MKKIVWGILIVAVLTGFIISGATTQAIVFIPTKIERSGVMVSVPDIAVDKSPALIPLEPGTLEKIVFIHYANGRVEAKAKTPACYKLLGIKWKSLPVSYVIHPDLDPGAISASTETWDEVTSKKLFNGFTIDSSANWDGNYPDGKNEYSLGNYPEQGVIAVTVVWSGVPLGGKGRQIIEYDVMFDTDFGWYNCAQTTCTLENRGMDLQNISTHETGHGVGLADVYDTACSQVTMYGYSDYGETKKRSLEQPDISGIQKLYGM